MDFLKNNLFYVILAVGVLVVSVPSYIVGSQRSSAIRVGQKTANGTLKRYEARVGSLELISTEALEKAKNYNEAIQQEQDKIIVQIEKADRHLDNDFIVPVADNGIPMPENYKQAYSTSYNELVRRIEDAGLQLGKKSPLPEKDDWKLRPSEFDIRVTQKKYWILKALVDVFTEPESGVKSVQNISLDYVPNHPSAKNHPEGGKERFWIYRLDLQFQMDVRKFPVLLEKLYGNEEVFFHPGKPGGYRMVRAFDPTQAVYVPLVAVSMYCEVWDYISTDFEKANLAASKQKSKGGGRRGGR